MSQKFPGGNLAAASALLTLTMTAIGGYFIYQQVDQISWPSTRAKVSQGSITKVVTKDDDSVRVHFELAGVCEWTVSSKPFAVYRSVGKFDRRAQAEVAKKQFENSGLMIWYQPENPKEILLWQMTHTRLLGEYYAFILGFLCILLYLSQVIVFMRQSKDEPDKWTSAGYVEFYWNLAVLLFLQWVLSIFFTSVVTAGNFPWIAVSLLATGSVLLLAFAVYKWRNIEANPVATTELN